jgi:hypothetical protein
MSLDGGLLTIKVDRALSVPSSVPPLSSDPLSPPLLPSSPSAPNLTTNINGASDDAPPPDLESKEEKAESKRIGIATLHDGTTINTNHTLLSPTREPLLGTPLRASAGGGIGSDGDVSGDDEGRIEPRVPFSLLRTQQVIAQPRPEDINVPRKRLWKMRCCSVCIRPPFSC